VVQKVAVETIRELARLAKCSKTTVARALNAQSRISEVTRQRILKLAESSGYRPDPNITSLMSRLRARKTHKQSVNIAWLRYGEAPAVPQTLPWFKNLWVGALNRAEQLGFTLDQVIEKESTTTPERLKKILLARGIVGLLDGPPRLEQCFEKFDCSPFAVALLGEVDHAGPYPHSSAHYFYNMGLLFEELRLRGYRRVGLLLGSYLHQIMGEAVVARFQYEQLKQGEEERIPWTPDIPNEGKGLSDWMKRWKPDVLICADNRLIKALNACGYRVPEDVGVLHLNLAEDVAGWSGIDQNHQLIGAAGVDLLADQIHRGELGKSLVPKEVFIPGFFVAGGTVRGREKKQ